MYIQSVSIVSLWLYCHRFGVNSGHSVAVIATGYPVAIATPNLMCMLRNTILAPRVQFRVVFKLCLCAASRALLEGPGLLSTSCRTSVTITILSPTTQTIATRGCQEHHRDLGVSKTALLLSIQVQMVGMTVVVVLRQQATTQLS